MPIDWENIKIEIKADEISSLLAQWNWLVPADFSPILVTSIGDMWLKDKRGQIFWLNVGVGSLDKVASSEAEFIVKMNNDRFANKWFMFELIQALKDSGLLPSKDELYGYILLPIIGGQYIVDNFQLTAAQKHFSCAGQIHFQLRDLPDGTVVNLDFQ